MTSKSKSTKLWI